MEPLCRQRGAAPPVGDDGECSWLYAGKPGCIRSVLARFRHDLDVGCAPMGSDNPMVSGPLWITPENQQERPGFEQWVVGFTDGEGCFSISVVRNPVCRLGWQAQHEFSVTQGAHSRDTLELLKEYFGCGTIIGNRRTDDHRSQLLRFSVKRRSDLIDTVIP